MVKRLLPAKSSDKCNSVFTSMINIIHYNYSYCQKATDDKDSSCNWPMSNLLDTMKVLQNLKAFEKLSISEE
jgi:hypothetical protein